MSRKPKGIMNYVLETDNYRIDLERLIKLKELPRFWFEHLDHVAFKAYNPNDYQRLIEQFKPMSWQISEVEMDGRYIAAARLLGKHALDLSMLPWLEDTYVDTVELMLARPEDQGDDRIRFDHLEAFRPYGLLPTKKVLERKAIPYKPQSNDSHSWISVLVNNQGQEIKFSDRSLLDIVDSDIESGRARIL